MGLLFTQVRQLLELLSGPRGLSLHSGETAVGLLSGLMGFLFTQVRQLLELLSGLREPSFHSGDDNRYIF